MKTQEIKKLSADKLKGLLLDSRKEQMNLRFQKATGQLENPNRWREVRKMIARIKTQLTALRSADANK